MTNQHGFEYRARMWALENAGKHGDRRKCGHPNLVGDPACTDCAFELGRRSGGAQAGATYTHEEAMKKIRQTVAPASEPETGAASEDVPTEHACLAFFKAKALWSRKKDRLDTPTQEGLAAAYRADNLITRAESDAILAERLMESELRSESRVAASLREAQVQADQRVAQAVREACVEIATRLKEYDDRFGGQVRPQERLVSTILTGVGELVTAIADNPIRPASEPETQ